MRAHLTRLTLTLSLLLLPGVVSSDLFMDSPSCTEPYKPYEFSDDWEYQNFLNEVDSYRDCISTFVEEQREAAQRHLEAADEAVEQWNRYVQYELQ